ncbi:MAG TPA: hypothetical protein VJ761_02330 [Ktedonobacteraceae bacterium]|nr:hypothetical protein [Ktedonobacteraceae bacterium]
MDEQKANETIEQMPKPIKWIIPDSIRTDHATHLIIQQQGSEFTLLFFEIQQPLLTGTPDEQISQYMDIAFVEAKCISKIVMSAENVSVAASNLVDSLNKLNSMLLTSKGRGNADHSENAELSASS